ncbi:MAG: hypothetical protein KGZ82_10690 [Bacteroidales bacterium]|nr:hypothetical protein [Bacteroidales bacterium]
MKKFIIVIIVIFGVIVFFNALLENEESQPLTSYKTIAKALDKAETVAEVDSLFKTLTDLREKITDSAKAHRTDSLLATRGAHTKRVALAEKNRAAAYAFELAKASILKGLKSPKTASFSGYNESKYWYYPKDDIYIVQLYVDAQNSFGAMIRQYYQIKLKKTNGEWRVVDLMEINGY